MMAAFISGGLAGLEPRAQAMATMAPGQGEPPVRLSADKHSQFYNPVCASVDVFLDGVRRPNDCVEYDEIEGWIDIRTGRGRKRLYGSVEPRWRERKAPAAQPLPVIRDERAVMAAAEAKRQRKAERLARQFRKKVT